MLRAVNIPGLLITGTDTGVGKTVIAAAIARWFAQREGVRAGVCKPVATGCVRRREGLVSEDAEFLAHCADTRFPLDLVCPQCYAEPLAPAIAAERAKQPLDWEAIDRALSLMSAGSDVMIVEGIGGIMTPMDDKHTFLDVAEWLRLPAIIVARAGLGTINHTLLTLQALRGRGIHVAGVVINRYPTDTPSTAEETSPKAIEKWGKVPVLCIVPDEPIPTKPSQVPIPAGIATAIGNVDWARFTVGR
jgi:dethiobiotin synthetase